MTVCLLGENQQVIQEFKADPVTLDPDNDDCSWKQVQHRSVCVPFRFSDDMIANELLMNY